MIILAGMVKATLQIMSISICEEVNPTIEIRVVLNGAMLNQETKIRKKAIQVKCRILCRPLSSLTI